VAIELLEEMYLRGLQNPSHSLIHHYGLRVWVEEKNEKEAAKRLLDMERKWGVKPKTEGILPSSLLFRSVLFSFLFSALLFP
jgi:hypothetical protein